MGPQLGFAGSMKRGSLKYALGFARGRSEPVLQEDGGAPRGSPRSWLLFASADGTRCHKPACGVHVSSGCAGRCAPLAPLGRRRGAPGRVLLALVTLCFVSAATCVSLSGSLGVQMKCGLTGADGASRFPAVCVVWWHFEGSASASSHATTSFLREVDAARECPPGDLSVFI